MWFSLIYLLHKLILPSFASRESCGWIHLSMLIRDLDDASSYFSSVCLTHDSLISFLFFTSNPEEVGVPFTSTVARIIIARCATFQPLQGLWLDATRWRVFLDRANLGLHCISPTIWHVAATRDTWATENLIFETTNQPPRSVAYLYTYLRTYLWTFHIGDCGRRGPTTPALWGTYVTRGG